jgi:hypothetical protein
MKKQETETALAMIADIGEHAQAHWLTTSTEELREAIRGIETNPRDWQEFATRAAQTKAVAIAQILQAIEWQQEGITFE